MIKIFIGYDPRDDNAYKVCERSLRKHSSVPLDVRPLKDWELRAKNLYQRPYRVDSRGQMVDERDHKPFSTQFAFTRFLVPALCEFKNEWVMFCDADMMFKADIKELFEGVKWDKSVYCVQHSHEPTESIKMDGVLQTTYPRKNWSSLMLMNPARCDSLTVYSVNNHSGGQLHGFRWVDDDKIGELPGTWNWLAGYSDPDIKPKNVHFTLGTPDMSHYIQTDYDAEWWDVLQQAEQGKQYYEA